MKFKIPKIKFKRKKDKRNQELLEDYQKGKVLQVDNNKNNKEFFKSIENDEHTKDE
jgi:hypothetical protein